MSHAPGSTIKPLVKLGKTPNDCFQWLGVVDEHGRAKKTTNGKQTCAQRWAWTSAFGPLPEGMVVKSNCGSLTCTNLHHLRACFHADACREAVHVMLVPGDVQEIRAAKKTKSTNTARFLAEKHGVHVRTIYDVWKRRSWAARKVRDEASA